MADSFDFLSVERTGPIATITIQRADKLNALNARVVAELTRAFHDLSRASADQEAVRAAILTGSGKAFVAGADIAEMATMTVAEAKRFSESGHRLGTRIEEAPF